MVTIKDQLSNLMMMTEHVIWRQDITLESYCWDLCQVEALNTQLLMQVMVLEATWDHLLEIPDSPKLVPIPAPGGNLLVEIDNGVDDEVAQAIVEDQAEGAGRRRVMIREGGAFRVAREFYKKGKDLMDVIHQVEAQDAEIPRYRLAPDYNDPNYVPDVQE